MADKQANRPTTADDIQFIQYHRPALQDGTYRITVEQTLSSGAPGEQVGDTKALYFSVLGPRFSLDPREVQGVFPPAGSSGDHTNVLPHIVLNRSTLPWERAAAPGDPETPWLALLLFDESDPQPEPRTLAAAELTQIPAFSGLADEIGHVGDEQVTVINVPQALLRAIAPSTKELGYLTHVRQWYRDTIPGGSTTHKGRGAVAVDGELAVIVGNRLPRPGAGSTVHLVSLEGRYDNEGFMEDHTGDPVTLVSLHRWQFSCTASQGNFRDLLEALDRDPGTLRLPAAALAPSAEGALHQATAIQYVSKGYVPLPHQLRTGDRTVSWYRGPLITSLEAIARQVKIRSVRAADELLRYRPDYGMFDVAYAAAWEIGRLLMLKSRKTSVNLFHWKRELAAKSKDLRKPSDYDHLPNIGSGQVASIPHDVAHWFEDLALLKQLPFIYLVPDERMLPVESIRFFCVDPHWVEALLDGAFSIGRTSNGELERDQVHREENLVLGMAQAERQVSGFLLRSQVVSGWPDLMVDGFGTAIHDIDPAPGDDQLLLLRMERLSPSILLCLFEGEVKTVDIHLKPEAIHFGLNPLDNHHTATHYPGGYFKALRSRSGLEEIAVARITGDVTTLVAALDAGNLGTFAKALKVMNTNEARSALAALDLPVSGSASAYIERDQPGSKWRIIKEEGASGNVRHWTYYLQRSATGLTIEKSLAINVPLRSDLAPTEGSRDSQRVIDIQSLFEELKEDLDQHFQNNSGGLFTAAEFALEMVAGVPKVRFSQRNDSGQSN